MTLPVDRPVRRWEDAGARVAPSLGGFAALLVTGDDPVAAARAAVGLGRVEALRRRVAIGDLVGDVPPLVALVDADDPHGIVDSFLYGVSLNKVAHPVRGTDNLFVLPTGTEPTLDPQIFRSDRWRRLASGFREVGALLLLVAPAGAPGLDALVEMLDGVVTVGDDTAHLARRFHVVATVDASPPVRVPGEAVVRTPPAADDAGHAAATLTPVIGTPVIGTPVIERPASAMAPPVTDAGDPSVGMADVPPADGALVPPADVVTGVPRDPAPADGDVATPARPRRRTPRVGREATTSPMPDERAARHGFRIAATLFVLVLGLVAAGLWALSERADTANSARTAERRAMLDSLRRARAAAAAPAPAPPETLPVLVPINPVDSAAATAYGIEIRKYNTEEGARMGHAQSGALPLASWFPVLLGNDRSVWYRLVGGAWPTRAAADSALVALRAAGVVDGSASVFRAPYALLVGSRITEDSARARAGRFVRDSVVPAEAIYSLRQDDGMANVYVGAFETPDQSMLLAQALQAGGSVPTLVYRTGRAF